VPASILDRAYGRFDHGTQRAILKLYRSASPAALAVAGERLGAIGAPALVVWGEDDVYVPAGFADAYAERLGGATRVERVSGAGHWPWLDDASVVDAVEAFLLES
jgi:pimeloyl-ACP methyl ester carboxylesterase